MINEVVKSAVRNSGFEEINNSPYNYFFLFGKLVKVLRRRHLIYKQHKKLAIVKQFAGQSSDYFLAVLGFVKQITNSYSEDEFSSPVSTSDVVSAVHDLKHDTVVK